MTPAPRRSRWQWQFGSVFGIPIRVHVTLLLLFVWIATTYWFAGLGPRGALTGVALMACVFVTIVAHELTHAVVARRFGVHTRDILLLPIGGIASLERIPERPAHELAVAVSGPALNLVIAGALWLGLALAGAPAGLADGGLGHGFVVRLLWINVTLAGFNLLPAFPLDGGRALRALLAMWLPRTRATSIAAGIGRGFAVVFGLVGLYLNPWLVVIAVFLWLAASREHELVRLRGALAGVPAAAAMTRRIDVVADDQPLAAAAALLVDAGGPALPVVHDGVPVAAVTPRDVAIGLEAEGPDAAVARAPQHAIVTVRADEPLDRVVDPLAGDAIAVVVDGGVPVGLITVDQLANYVAMHAR